MKMEQNSLLSLILLYIQGDWMEQGHELNYLGCIGNDRGTEVECEKSSE